MSCTTHIFYVTVLFLPNLYMQPIKNKNKIICVHAMKAYWCVDVFHSIRPRSTYTISLERGPQNATILAFPICGPIQVSSCGYHVPVSSTVMCQQKGFYSMPFNSCQCRFKSHSMKCSFCWRKC